jgi:hypothetical protein
MRRRHAGAARAALLCAVLLASPGAAAGTHDPFDAPVREEAQRIVAGQIAAGRVPGAVVLAGDAQRVLYRLAAGNRARLPRDEPMTADTAFDLASLTKVVACIPRASISRRRALRSARPRSGTALRAARAPPTPRISLPASALHSCRCERYLIYRDTRTGETPGAAKPTVDATPP